MISQPAYIPTQEEIEEKTAEIRAGWSTKVRRQRRESEPMVMPSKYQHWQRGDQRIIDDEFCLIVKEAGRGNARKVVYASAWRKR